MRLARSHSRGTGRPRPPPTRRVPPGHSPLTGEWEEPVRKVTALVASGLLLGGVIVASPAAWANGLDDFELTGEFTDFDGDDNGRDGPSEGDTFDFKMDLFDEDGDEAGDGDGTCELTDVNREDREFTADCSATFNLDDGDLEMEGEVTDEDFR